MGMGGHAKNNYDNLSAKWAGGGVLRQPVGEFALTIKEMTPATLLFTATAALASLPDGWRLPTQADLAHEDRSRSPTRYARVDADFDGDGKKDVAVLAVSAHGHQEALLVHLSSESGWQLLDSHDWGKAVPDGFLGMGIEVVAPGKHRTLEEGPVVLRLPGIDYFRFESANSIFYWDTKKKSFVRIWQSD